MPKPNILFFFTDDQRYDTLHALGNPHIHTPNLDWLLEQGTVFTHAHIPGGTSPAVCMPSRAMIHTGRTLFHLTEGGRIISPEHVTLGEAFRSAGYHTFGTGKWHNETEAYARSFSAGAEIFFGGMADHWNVPAYDFAPAGKYDHLLLEVPNPGSSNELRERRGDHVHAGRHSTDTITEAALRFIEEQDAESPFLAYVSYLAPHDPRTMPREFLERYDPEELPLPENFMGGHPFDNGELHVRDEMLAGFPRTPEETRRHLAEYYAMISHLDARLGDLLTALRKNELLENTIVVMAGDNGLALGQHGLFGKQSLYEHSTRVPLVFSGPGVPVGARSRALVYLLDIFPTLCDLAGLETPDTVEGVSLVPALQAPEALVRNSLYLAYTDKHRGVRTDRYKLIEYVVRGRHTMTQLFDLAEDPAEVRNLATDPAYADLLGELRTELFRLREAWDDQASSWGKTFWQGYGA